MRIKRLALVLLFLSTPAWAFDLQLIHGDREWSLSMDELSDMPITELETDTPWTEEAYRYSGVSVQTLLDMSDLDQNAIETLRLVALNDYAVEAPLSVLLESEGVLVFERDGEPMPVRDYGPYWMLFPFTERPELERREVRNVSVWQLKTIELLP